MDKKEIGNLIKSNREKKKISLEEFAKLFDIDVNTVKSWEEGKVLPDFKYFKSFSNLFGISIVELMNGSEVDDKDYKNVSEENISELLSEVDFKYKYKKNSILFMIFNFLGVLLFLIGYGFRFSGYRWTLAFDFSGALSIGLSFKYLTKYLGNKSRIIIPIVMCLLFLGVSKVSDNIGVENNHKPRYYISKEKVGTCIMYKSLFKDAVYDTYYERYYADPTDGSYLIYSKWFSKIYYDREKAKCLSGEKEF